MLLKDAIADFQKERGSQIPQDVRKMMMAATEKLIESGIAGKALKEGDKAPPFSLPNVKGERVSLSDLLRKGPVVLSFYRGSWCPYCNLEIQAYIKAYPEIKELGAQLVAVSPNLPDKSLETAEKNSLEFEVLSDVGNKVAREFGLIFAMAEELRPIYKKFGHDIPKDNGDDSWELPIPATYVINSASEIVLSYVDADYTKRLEPADAIDALKKLKK